MKVLWQPLTWAAVAALIYIAFTVFDIRFDPPNWLVSLFFGAMGAQFVLNANQERWAPKPSKKERDNFWGSGERQIVPKHAVPTLEASGWGMDGAVHRFFADFALFGVIANDEMKQTPWRLQEGPLYKRAKTQKRGAGVGGYDTHLLMLGDTHGPRHGRQFDVFYNQFRVGGMEVTNGWEYSTENPNVHAAIEIDDARLISSGTLMHFLNTMGDLLSDTEDAHKRQTLDALATAHWDQSTHGPLLGLHGRDVRVEFSGTATRYMMLRKNWLEREKERERASRFQPQADQVERDIKSIFRKRRG
jgi:hypothetical protein